MEEEEIIVTDDETEDDAFCEQLLKEYEADPDKGEYVSMEEMIEMCREE